MEVVLAPDSFKGGPDATAVAEGIARGWRRHRPSDRLVLSPLADGGEGTLDALAAAAEDAERHVVADVTGPDGRPVAAAWLLLPDRTAVVELASSSGLPLVAEPDPLSATTRGVGEVIAAALDRGARRLLVGLGGSASTDAGSGLLRALGLELLDEAGQPVPDGARGLLDLAEVRTDRLRPPPVSGVVALTDVDNPLLGERGAAPTFGPQKGATPEQVVLLERALRRFAALVGGPTEAAGAGAAGGTAYGLAALWDAELRSGGRTVAEAAGLRGALRDADLVVTGEGAFDATSLGGKVASAVLDEAERAGVPVAVVAGRIEIGPPPPPLVTWGLVALAELAGSPARSLAAPERWLEAAGQELARAAEQHLGR